MRTRVKIVWSAVFGLLMVWAALAQIAPHLFGINTDRQTVLRWLTPWVWNPALLWLALPLAYGWLAWWLFTIDSKVEAVTAALPRDRPEAAALEDADTWQYPEMDGPVWRYNNICLLPIPERERLKREKPAVWAAYWEETLRRPQYVLPDGRRLTKSDIFAMNTMNRLLLGRVDPDVMDWYMHGREF